MKSVKTIPARWLSGFVEQFLPSPQRVRLAIENRFRSKPSSSEKRFLLVLCWLENDPQGHGTKVVERAFRGVKGIKLVRSERIIAAGGAADDWRPAMRKSARRVLEEWRADLAVVGEVTKVNKALNLWFVPREGDDTLGRGDRPYELKNVTLKEDFHDDLRAQLAAVAWTAVAPLADTETRGRMLEEGLTDAIQKLAGLLDGGTITEPEHRAKLSVAYGNALQTLGERESGTKNLKKAVAAFNEALEVYTRERVPLDWAMAQNNLGAALVALSKLESRTENLEKAVAAFNEALKERIRQRVPLQWAETQNNLGAALQTLGERESETENLEKAVAAFNEALKEHTRERVPLEWAATQNNLGAALWTLGKRESGTEYLEKAVAAFDKALKLKECTRERVPLQWATTQNNLGLALLTLGKRESGTEYLEKAVAAFDKALEVFTLGETPRYRKVAESNRAWTLELLREREQTPD